MKSNRFSIARCLNELDVIGDRRLEHTIPEQIPDALSDLLADNSCLVVHGQQIAALRLVPNVTDFIKEISECDSPSRAKN